MISFTRLRSFLNNIQRTTTFSFDIQRSVRTRNSRIAQWNVAVQEQLKTNANKETIDLAPRNIQINNVLHKKVDIRPVDNIQITPENQYEELAKVVTPLYKIPYEKQLQMKFIKCVKILQKFGKILKRENKSFVTNKDGLPCPLECVYPSPVSECYRNKDEYSVRTGIDGNSKTCGYFIGSPSDNTPIYCVNPYHLINIKDSHKLVVKEFENYIRQSPLPACENFAKGGHWRNLIVRSNSKNDVMAIVIIHPQNMSKEKLDEEKKKLAEYFTKGSGRKCNLKSLFFQACCHTKCTHEQAPFELLFGEPYILEEINGLTFCISPESFFQVNSSAAPALFDAIKELCRPTKNATILDVCCGTGTIGLNLAQDVKNVIGIEVNEQAIIDAKQNAMMNGIKNASYFCGKAEEIIPSVMPSTYMEDCIAILNPARQGLSTAVIHALRDCKHLQKIVYVSCKPEGKSMDNFVELCKSLGKKRLGQPFMPILAAPVDLFPHTEHCELAILFERLK